MGPSNQPRGLVPSIQFFQPWTPSMTDRERELELSHRRSHARRVAWLQKEKKSKQIDIVPAGSPGRTGLKKRETRQSKDDEQSNQELASHNARSLLLPREGQSDPFDSFPVRVTPEINRIMTFARDFYLPMTSLPRRFRGSVNQRSSRALQVNAEHILRKQTIDRWIGLASSSGEAILAFFAFYAVCLHRALPDAEKASMHKIALMLKVRLIETIRAAMHSSGEDSTSYSTLVQKVVYLFSIDCYERNHDAAVIHARVLEAMLHKLQDPAILFHLLVEALFYDTELACYKLRPALLNQKYWYDKILKPLWVDVQERLHYTPPATEIHPSITHCDMQQAVLRTRHGFAIYDSRSIDNMANETANPSYQYAWWSDGVVHDTAVMLNLALSLSASAFSAEELSSKHPQSYLDAALAFAICCTIRKYRRDGINDNVELDVQDFSEVLAPALQGYTQTCFDSATSEVDDDRRQEALYWILFTGTLYEQTICRYQHKLMSNTEKAEYWFTAKLREQAQLLRLTTWEKAQTLLQTFLLQADWLDPHPEDWYEQVVK